jgi:hypothetical protein
MIGSATGTGTITLGQSNATNTINIGSAAPGNTSIQTVNIATGAENIGTNEGDIVNIATSSGTPPTTTSINRINIGTAIAGQANGNGVRIGNSHLSFNKPTSAVVTAVNTTLTASQILDAGIIVTSSPGAPVVLTMPDASGVAGLVQAMPWVPGTTEPAIGDIITFLLVNNNGGVGYPINITGNASLTVSGNAQYLPANSVSNPNISRIIYCRVTSIGAGTETMTIY